MTLDLGLTSRQSAAESSIELEALAQGGPGTVPLGHDTGDDRPSMKLSVDRDLPVPLGVQLRGLIEYGITCGELLPGARLPSVRELAEELGVAPMTVSQVYRELRDGGLIEARAGLGTFVTESMGPAVGIDPRVIALQRRLDGLTEEALALGLGPGELTSMITARFARHSARPHRPLRAPTTQDC
jgi:DNA-binding transcriptional regulator YhcF (GntR family)